MRCLAKEKHIILPIHNSQAGVISLTTNMSGAAYKGITSPTLGQWLVSLLCLHQLMEGLLNRQVSRVIMMKIIDGQDLNKIGPSLTYPNDLHRTISQAGLIQFIGSHGYITNAAPVP